MSDDAKWTKAVIKIGVLTASFVACAPALAESEVELWRSGFKEVWKSSYADVEECEPEKPVKLEEGLYFECSGYNYVYHYGAVSLMSKSITFQGHSVAVTYLCMDGKDECLAGIAKRLR